VLVDGLPINGDITPELFVRAAQRAGFSAKIAQRNLSELSNLLMPVVLLHQDGSSSLLRERRGSILVLEQPESGGVVEIEEGELRKLVSGTVIFVKPEYRSSLGVSDVNSKNDKHWFWGTVWRSKAIYRDVLIASLLINLFVIANPLFVMNVYDRVVPNSAVDTLWVLALGVGLVYLFDFGLKLLRAYFLEVAAKKSDILLSSTIFQKVLGMRFDVMPASVGAFSSNLREFDSIRSLFSAGSVALLIDIPFMVIFILVVWYIGGSLAMIPMIAVPLILLYTLAVKPALRSAVEKSFSATAQKNGALVEALTAMETVKTQRAVSPMVSRWDEAVGHIARWGLKARILSLSVGSFSGLVQQVASIALIILGVYLIIEQQLTMGALIACNILVGRAIAPMAQISSLVIQYEQASKALKTLNSIMELPDEREATKHYVHRENLTGQMEFKNVDFTYPNSEVGSLNGVSFSIKQGEKVALIGRIGSGKSTIQKLLAGLYKPQSGAITLDGIDINQIDPVDLRRNLGYLPQDVLLFAGTLRENIVIGLPSVSDERLLEVAKLTGVDQFVAQHPLGFDMPVGERGAGLSGGQRQAIGLARSLLHQPNMLLLDEPSNSMDNASEEYLRGQLEDFIKDRTLLLVTHKVSLLQLVDRIIVVDRGQIVADGPKETVLEALRQGRLQVRR
jgi:ATP-binding cassette subfamily C protein LapB